MITPGLFDLQANGFAGVDFNDAAITPTSLDHALELMLVCGVTGVLPTIITALPDQLTERFRALDAAVASSRLGRAMIPGYHLEGPFISDIEGYRGCHPQAAMCNPDTALIDDLDAQLDRPILLVTLAPERAGGNAAVERLVAAGKTVAVGHSAAGHVQIRTAADAGISLSTHLGNGLPQSLPKLENTLLAQLAEARISACLIADGHHMSPEVLSALIRLKGTENSILVTDSVSAAAAPPGKYQFASMEVTADDKGLVRQPGSTGLAGSSLRLDAGVRNVTTWGICDAPTAVRMASVNPRAALARSFDRYGLTIEPGRIEWNSALEPKVLTIGSVPV